MRLIYWPTCPFACKVLGVLKAIGQLSRVELVPFHPWEADSPLKEHNPLHKVPVLITDDKLHIYDSRVIVEYLDRHHNGENLIPPLNSKTNERWEVLTLQSLADGMMDAAILKLTEENVRADVTRSIKWTQRQSRVIEAALSELESQSVHFYRTKTNIGLIAVFAALSYLDYRYGGRSWRGTHPRLATWYERVAEDPIYQATIPVESYEVPDNLEQLNE